MVAEGEIVQYRCVAKGSNIQKIEDVLHVSPPSSPVLRQIVPSDSESIDNSRSGVDDRSLDTISDAAIESAILQFVPSIRSGSCANIGPQRACMEDEHIRIDDLATQLGSLISCPTPSAFYGVFDGHEGPDAAAYVRNNAIRFFFEDADFPQASEANGVFLEEVQNSIRKAFLRVDLAMADDPTVRPTSGTTALTALILGRFLLVANAGDCRAVLCRNGKAVEMSQDHKPIDPSERRRIEELGGHVNDIYLNGVLSVSRALGDWDMKLPRGSQSPLIAEPEFRQEVLTEDDEFLIIGCDGIWDVMSSQDAVSFVRRGLRRHDNPEQCARDLVMEAIRLSTSDNLTVIVVCFSSSNDHQWESSPPRQQRLRCCSLSTGALCNLNSWLDRDGSRGV